MSTGELSVGVVGGSLGGLFAAALLRRAGHDVTVLERSQTGLSRRGAGLVGQQDLFDALARLGLRSVLRSGVEARERIILDGAGSIVHRDPTPQTQLSWDVLWEGLRALIPDERYRLGATSAFVRPGARPEVLLDSGETHSFDLVVGADGLGSTTRACVAPKHAENQYAGYVTWRGLVPEDALPADAARTLLGRFAFYTAPGEHMLGYLVPGARGETSPGSRRYNWVWYRPLSADALRALMTAAGHSPAAVSLAPGDLPDAAARDLRAAAVDALPTVFAEAVLAEPAPFLQAIFDYVPPHMTTDGVALLGDAAVVVRPHTAMGAAKAAGDAMALVDELASAPTVRDALAVYDRDRLAVGRSIARYGRRLGESLPL